MKDVALRRLRLEERATCSCEADDPPRPKRPAHVTRLQGHPATVWRILTLPCANLVVTACVDGRVRVYKMDGTRRPIHELEGHIGEVFDLASLGAEVVVSVGADGRIVVWNVVSGKQLQSFDSQVRAITAVAAVSHNTLVVGSLSGELIYFRHNAGHDLHRVGRSAWAHRKIIGFIASHRNHMVVATLDGSASVWDVDTRRKLAYLRNNGPVHSAAINDELVATGTADEVRLFSRHSGFPLVKTYRGLGGRAMSFAGVSLLLSARDDGVLSFIRPLTDRPLARVKTRSENIVSVSISGDGRIACSDHDGNCELLCLRNVPQVATILNKFAHSQLCERHSRRRWILTAVALVSVGLAATVRRLHKD